MAESSHAIIFYAYTAVSEENNKVAPCEELKWKKIDGAKKAKRSGA